MDRLDIFLSDLISKSRLETQTIWESAFDGNIMFITNRLSNDGAANVTEYQANVIKEKLNKNCIIVTGRKTNLWSGKTPVDIIPGLDIPHSTSTEFISEKRTLLTEETIINEALSISAHLEKIIRGKKISLVFAQNTNSLCYNISAAIAVIYISTKLSLPIIHQCFDFFWEHTYRNRKIFDRLKYDAYAANIYRTIGTWNQSNWSWTFHTNSFKELSANMGVPKTLSYLLLTPVFKEESGWKKYNIKFNDEVCLGKRFKITYGRYAPDTSNYKIVIPAKISRKKKIFETIENILEIFCLQKPLSNLRITITGGLYDMENDEGFNQLNNQFNKLLAKAKSIIEMSQLSQIEFQFLGGVKRFTNQEFTIMDVFKDNDIVCYGSDIETDCLAIFEACLQKKIVWIVPWIFPYDAVFNDLFKSLVVSPMNGVPGQKMLFPFEFYSDQVTNFNSKIIKKKRSKHLFVKQLKTLVACQAKRTFSYNSKYIKKAKLLYDLHSEKGTTLIVLIGGNPNTGKSTFCMELVKRLRVKNLKAGIISLDDYSIPIELTQNKKYEPCSIEIGKLTRDIQNLLGGKVVFRNEYQHGQKGKASIPLYNLDILLIEGVFALLTNQKSADDHDYDELQALADFKFEFVGNKNFLTTAIEEDAKRNLNLFERHERLINKIEQVQIAKKYVSPT